MAVIRQRQQFRNQRIGVVRAGTGESQLWQQVGSFADNLVSNAFEAAKVKADERGVEVAQQLSEEKLRTIDPVTGRIEAFNVPEKFGTIAQQAYKRTMEKRYVRSIESEIKTKAGELAIKYQFDPQGPEKYSSMMEDYISGMVKNGDPQFRQMTKEIGGTYLASTKLNLMSQRAQRQQEAAQLDLSTSADEASLQLRNLGEDNDAEVLFQLEVQDQQDAVEAGLQSDSMAKANISKMRRSRISGILLPSLATGARIESDTDQEGNVVYETVTEEDAKIVETMIHTGNEDRLKELPAGLQRVYKNATALATDSTDLDQLRLDVTKARSDLAGQATISAAQQKTLETFTGILNGNASNSTYEQDVANDMILRDVNPDNQGSYYRSPESLTNSGINALALKQAMPSGLLRDLRNLANGTQFNPQEVTVLMNHYAKFSKYTTGQGTFDNLLRNANFEKEDDAILRSAAFISFAKGSQDLPAIIAQLRDNALDSSAFKQQEINVFGDKAKNKDYGYLDYTREKFANNLQAAEVVAPYVKYLIAGGASKSDIDATITQVYEATYTETEGFIIDPLYGVEPAQRSMFSLKRMIPDQVVRDKFKVAVANALPDGFHIGRGEREGSRRVYLVPQILSGSAISDELGSSSITYHAMYQDDDGSLIPFPAIKLSNGQETFMTFSPQRMKQFAREQFTLQQQQAIEAGAATEEQKQEALRGSQTGVDAFMEIPSETGD